MSPSRRFRDGAASGGGTRGGGGSVAERVVTRRARFSSPIERWISAARGAPRPREVTESRWAVRGRHGAEFRISREWFASRGDYSVKSDVDPSGESDAAVWHLSHGIPREFWRWELWRWSAFFRERGAVGRAGISTTTRARERTRDERTRTRRPTNSSSRRPDPASTRNAHRSRIRACIHGPVDGRPCRGGDEKKPWVPRSRTRRTCTA